MKLFLTGFVLFIIGFVLIIGSDASAIRRLPHDSIVSNDHPRFPVPPYRPWNPDGLGGPFSPGPTFPEPPRDPNF